MIKKLEQRFRFSAKNGDFYETSADQEVRRDGTELLASDIGVGECCEVDASETSETRRRWVRVTRVPTPEVTAQMDHEIHQLCVAMGALMFCVGTAKPDGDRLVFWENEEKKGLANVWADAYDALAKLEKLQSKLNGHVQFSPACGRIWQHIYTYVRECGGDPCTASLGRCISRDRLGEQLATDRKNPDLVPDAPDEGDDDDQKT